MKIISSELMSTDEKINKYIDFLFENIVHTHEDITKIKHYVNKKSNRTETVRTN